jgi:hypothetical protein
MSKEDEFFESLDKRRKTRFSDFLKEDEHVFKLRKQDVLVDKERNMRYDLLNKKRDDKNLDFNDQMEV